MFVQKDGMSEIQLNNYWKDQETTPQMSRVKEDVMIITTPLNIHPGTESSRVNDEAESMNRTKAMDASEWVTSAAFSVEE